MTDIWLLLWTWDPQNHFPSPDFDDFLLLFLESPDTSEDAKGLDKVNN